MKVVTFNAKELKTEMNKIQNTFNRVPYLIMCYDTFRMLRELNENSEEKLDFDMINKMVAYDNRLELGEVLVR